MLITSKVPSALYKSNVSPSFILRECFHLAAKGAYIFSKCLFDRVVNVADLNLPATYHRGYDILQEFRILPCKKINQLAYERLVVLFMCPPKGDARNFNQLGTSFTHKDGNLQWKLLHKSQQKSKASVDYLNSALIKYKFKKYIYCVTFTTFIIVLIQT
jgi:hypothetical protein